MRSIRGTSVVVLVLGLLATLAPALPLGGAVAAGAAATYDWSAVDARLDQATDGCAEVCGVNLTLGRIGASPTDDDVILTRPYGTWDPNRLFWTASAGKWVAGAVVMSVVDDGLLSLDSKVGDFFPAYAGTQKGNITVRQLFSHTAGWTGSAPCTLDPTTTLDACAQNILTQSLTYTPGTKFAYVAHGFQVGGAIVERATGKPWGQVFQENIATPLGLTQTAWGSATNPRIDGGTDPTGLRSTVAEYDRFLEMILHDGDFRGTQVLSPAAIDAMETDYTAGLPRINQPNPHMLGYGIGVWIEATSAGKATLVTSPGAFGTYPWVDRTRGVRGTLSMQSGMSVGITLYDAVRPLVNTQTAAVPAGTPPPPMPPFPDVTAVSPTWGSTTGGQPVSITGTGFTGATEVLFGSGLAAPSFTVDSDTHITAVSPAHAVGSVSVQVRTRGGLSAGGAGTWFGWKTYAVPDVNGVSPNSGPTTGGQTVTITGTGFTGATAVTFGPTPATAFTVVNDTTITATTPARAAALVNVYVTGPGGTSPAEAWVTWYRFVTPVAPPDVNGVSPNSGPTTGGQTVTITGTGFTGATAVTFGPTPATAFTVVNDTTITATTPARAAALVNVYVTGPGGTSPAEAWVTWYRFT